MGYWLFKSEPGSYSIDDLKRDRTTFWDGVRNYQARNYLRDTMKKGDGVLFYHSNADVTGVVGLAEIVKAGEPDLSALDPKHKYYDPDSSARNNPWFGVTLRFRKKFATPVTLADLKADPRLSGMLVLQRGQRLSVMPVEPPHFDAVLAKT